VKAWLDTGFLLTILTHRSGAEEAWALLRKIESSVGISSLQLFVVKHGLTKAMIDLNAPEELQEVCVRATKLLNWLLQQDVLKPVELEYEEMIALADSWVGKLRTPLASLLILWPAAAVVSGAKIFLSFDPRTRALAKAAGLKLLPERL
jgi:hypothetical protein